MNCALFLGAVLTAYGLATGVTQTPCSGLNCPWTTSRATLRPASTRPPITTTPKPTPTNHTTPTPTNHTTSKPTPTNHTTPTAHTTTTAHVTVIPSPTPHTDPEPGKYNVTQGNKICLKVFSSIQIRVRYNTTHKQEWGIFYIHPNKVKPSGTCGEVNATLNLKFPEGHLSFVFKRTPKSFLLVKINSSITYAFPGTKGQTVKATNDKMEELSTPLGKSYSCSNRSLEVSEFFWVDLMKDHIQAFNFSKSNDFGPVTSCPQDGNHVVAIVVGVVVAVLIIVVIIAYCVGRKRNNAGYQSI
eukprot:gi/632991891/ref/XP_007884831.1/ PREDICTED: macrosialin [Callorhinchus milii]